MTEVELALELERLRRENVALREAFDGAPHTPECASRRDFCCIPEHGKKRCDCWRGKIVEIRDTQERR